MTEAGRYISGGLAFSLIAFMSFAAGVYATEETNGSAAGRAADKLVLPGDPALIARVRGFSQLQQRVVDGDGSALGAQIDVARLIAKSLRQENVATWKTPRHLRALIKYVLSGGDPTVLRHLVDTAYLPDDKKVLAGGVVAYSRGQHSDAAALLNQVDHYSLPPSLAGHVALVKAVLASQTSNANALAFCQDAILLSPGTHIEEAALRLTISVAIKMGDAKTLRRAHIRHLLRFSNSLYASSIDGQVARIVVANPQADTSAQQMETLSALVSPPRRQAYFGQLAEAALRGGKVESAVYAARLARSAMSASSPSASAYLAIEGAALVLTPDRKKGIQRLSEARASAPNGETADLIAAAQGLVNMIEAPAPSDTEALAALPPPARPTASPTPGGKRRPLEAVFARGTTAFAAADQLIEQSRK